MKVLTVVLAICMLSIIGCSNDEEEYNSEFFSSKAGEAVSEISNQLIKKL